jgi:predicted small lipoprotein YifL
MKRLITLVMLIIAPFQLAGCGSTGSSAPPPENVSIVAGDSMATIKWDMAPGVEYWVFRAAGTSVTPDSCYGMPQCQILIRAVSPFVVAGLVNGTNYAFTINGRIDGGKGGAGSPSVQALPRLAGATWSAGNSLGSSPFNDFHGISYGSVYAAAGSNGALFSSIDGISWTPALNNPVVTNLNASTYFGGHYQVAGDAGVILHSNDATNWTQQTAVTSQNLYAVTNNANGGYVATGAAGTILYSSDALNWSAAISSGLITSQPLNAVTYGNGLYVAVGAAGTIINSTNGTNWLAASSISSSISALNLTSVAYGAGVFVALGEAGTVVTSTDGATWTVQSAIATLPAINAVTYGRQFVGIANNGAVFYSTNGITWTQASSPTTSPLYALTHGVFDYTAVGAGGFNMRAN